MPPSGSFPRGHGQPKENIVQFNFDFDPAEENVATTGVDDMDTFLYRSAPSLEELSARLPDPFLEVHRASVISEVRDTYSSTVRTLLKINPPKDSLNRWILEQLTLPTAGGADPFLRNVEELRDNPTVLVKELVKELPYRPRARHMSLMDALRDMCKYIDKLNEFCKRIDGQGTSSVIGTDEYKDLRKCIAVASAFVHNCKINTNFDTILSVTDIEDGIIALQDASYKVVSMHYSQQLKDIISAVISSCVTGRKALDEHKAEKDSNESKYKCEVSLVQSNKVYILKPTITPEPMFVKEALREMKINVEHVEKLRLLYANACGKHDPNFKMFKPTIFCLLRRYNTMFGEDEEGANFHAAAPSKCFFRMRKKMRVSQELFASPLNCYFRRFCSAFPDIDVFFGSRGSFNEFKPISGTFEVGPPYTEEVMLTMAKLLESHLDKATQDNKELCFYVFVPEWRMPPCEALDLMDKSQYNRAMRVATGNRHNYIVGAQHTVEAKSNQRGNDRRNMYKVPHGTIVYALMSPLYYNNHFADSSKTNLNAAMDKLIKTMSI